MSVNRHLSRTVPKPADRRVERTRLSIDEAFIRLLQRRAYDSIRVSDIVRKANIGRATFYAHYRTKDELLQTQLHRVARSLIVARPREPWLLEATALFRHVRDVRPLFRAVTSPGSGTRVSRLLQDCIDHRVLEIIGQRPRAGIALPAGMPAPLAARFVAATLLSLLGWWAEYDMKQTPEEMQSIFQRLIGRGLIP